MKEFYEFASNNPWLTFFIFIIVCEMIVRIFNAIFNHKEEENEEE